MGSKISTEEIVERVVRKAGNNFELSANCAKSPLAALVEEFSLSQGRDVIKAAQFIPGLASRSEACGAVVAGLLALGLVFGKAEIFDPQWKTPEGIKENYKGREKAYRFCETFKKEFGSTMCGNIRPPIMGSLDYVHYDGMDPKWRERFLAEGGATKCRVPVEAAARIAASIILED